MAGRRVGGPGVGRFAGPALALVGCPPTPGVGGKLGLRRARAAGVPETDTGARKRLLWAMAVFGVSPARLR